MDLRAHGWRNGWELVASGDGRKLERFGQVLLDRPAPQAIWPAGPDAPWRQAQAAFQRGEGGTGDWERGSRPAPERWVVPWRTLRFEIRLTSFGNVGLFPEHAAHWEWVEKDAVVSLFSYSDFVYQQPKTKQNGSTNVTGSIIRFDYMLFPNLQLTAKSHFINALDPGIATSTAGKPLGLIGSSTLTRLQLDAVLKF